ncbi:MAG: bestrophin family ion channel, partial [Fuerstiella sp.]|nr:bestrophin family ion channel [Fuerstiella sp.]
SSGIQVKRFIFMFLISLPFALLRQFQYEEFATTVVGMQFSTSIFLVPIFVMLVSYPLLSLDRIGMELQNPFDPRRLDDLPLDRICETIERNLVEILGVETLDHEEADAETLDLGKKTRHRFASETYIS